MQRLSLDTSAFRVRNLKIMRTFCSEMLRLPLLLSSMTTAMFELGTDNRGNTQVLMLTEDEQSPLQRLALETSEMEFAQACQHLLKQGAYLFQSENSSAPGCAWRILSCSAPEGHKIILLNIDPSRCSPTLSTQGDVRH